MTRIIKKKNSKKYLFDYKYNYDYVINYLLFRF